MTSRNVLKEGKAREKERQRDIEEELAHVNTTPTRVEVSSQPDGESVTIRRIPLLWRLRDVLGHPFFWVFGGLLGLFASSVTAEQVGLGTSRDPLGLWLGLPIGVVLMLLLWMGYFVLRFRSLHIRIEGNKFWFDSWNGKQFTGKVSKKRDRCGFEVDLGGRFLERGWVALDIKVKGRLHGELTGSVRQGYRLKLDDARALREFLRGNGMSVDVYSTVPITKAHVD